MLSVLVKSDNHHQDTSYSTWMKSSKLYLTMYYTHTYVTDRCAMTNWFCSVACIWAHCDTKYKWYRYNIFECCSIRHCIDFWKQYLQYCTVYSLSAHNYIMKTVHHVCKIWIKSYCNVFCSITWIEPSLVSIILPCIFILGMICIRYRSSRPYFG